MIKVNCSITIFGVICFGILVISSFLGTNTIGQHLPDPQLVALKTKLSCHIIIIIIFMQKRWGSKSNLPVASLRFWIPFSRISFLLLKYISCSKQIQFKLFWNAMEKWGEKPCLYLEVSSIQDFTFPFEIHFLFKTTPDGELSIFGTAMPHGKVNKLYLEEKGPNRKAKTDKYSFGKLEFWTGRCYIMIKLNISFRGHSYIT